MNNVVGVTEQKRNMSRDVFERERLVSESSGE